MRPLRFWIAALSVAVAAGALAALWPRGSDVPPAPAPALAPARPPAPLPPAPPPSPPAAAPRPPSPASPSPAPEAAVPAPEPAGEPDRAFVRESLKEAFEEKMPDRHLTDDDYDRLASAVLRMRAARRKMSGLAISAENAAELAALREELNTAVADFESVSGLTPGDFTALVEPDLQPIQERPAEDEATGGTKSGKDRHGGIKFEYLKDTPPR